MHVSGFYPCSKTEWFRAGSASLRCIIEWHSLVREVLAAISISLKHWLPVDTIASTLRSSVSRSDRQLLIDSFSLTLLDQSNP